MGLIRYSIRRILQAIPVVIGIVTITFFLTEAMPASPVEIMVGPSPSQQQIEAIRARYGLDKPVWVRYFNYVFDMLQLHLGRSFYYGAPVKAKIAERMPRTLLLMISAYIFAIGTAIPLGVISAKRRNKPTDHVSRVVSLIGVSTPSFWIGLVLILIFSYRLDVLPATSLIVPWAAPANVSGASSRLDVFITSFKHLLLPMISLGTLQMAALTRIERSSMLEALSEEYVKLARAYGVSERTILRKHAFRNAQLEIITIIGLNLTQVIGGAVLTETVFSINGMGTLFFTALQNQDYPLILGLTFIFGIVFIVGVILTDISYAYIDPRITYGGED